MIILSTNFAVNTAVTVKDGYSWDKGAPVLEKSLRIVDDYVIGAAPATRVTFDVNGAVLAPFRDKTLFTFNFDDYYNETKTLSTYIPRAPIHPAEDKYNIIWDWNSLTVGEATFRKTLTYADFLSGNVPLPFLSAGLSYPITRSILSAYYISIMDTLNTTPVYYERWNGTYGFVPNLLTEPKFNTPADIINVQPSFDYTLPFYELINTNSGINTLYNVTNNQLSGAREMFEDERFFTKSPYRGSPGVNLNIKKWAALAPGLTPGLSGYRAAKIEELPSGKTNQQYYIDTEANTVLPNNNWAAASVFVRANGRNKIRLKLLRAAANDPQVDWDLSTGEVLSTANSGQHRTVYCGNNWWHLTLIFQRSSAPTTTGNTIFRIQFLKDDEKVVTKYTDSYTNGILPSDPNPPGYYLYAPRLRFQTGAFASTNVTASYNQIHRMTGYFTPPSTNFYYFWLAANSMGMLFLTEAGKEKDLTTTPEDFLIAQTYEPGTNNGNENMILAAGEGRYDRFLYQQSVPKKLIQGKIYYIEARYYQAITTGFSYFNVGWSGYNPGARRARWFNASEGGSQEKIWTREGYLAGGQLTHTYSIPGIYSPSLTVSIDDAALNDNYIYDDTEAKFAAVELYDAPPTAGFIALSTIYGYSPVEIEFSAKSTVTGSLPT